MGPDRDTPMTLSEQRARKATQEQTRQHEAELSRFLDAWGAFHLENGLLSDEFGEL